jgi:hypothetical protein
MNTKDFWLQVTGTIFGVVALLHLLRIASGVQVIIGDFLLPLWVNWMGLIVTAFLCLWLWRLSGKKEA